MNQILENCPHCDGKIIETEKGYCCENYFEQKCNFKINKTIANIELTIEQIRTLLKGETTDFIEGFKKADSTFNSKLYLDKENHEVKFDSSVTNCPKCNNGKLKEFSKSYSCSNYKGEQSCVFSVWKYQYGGIVTKKNLIDLCSTKETEPIEFKTKEGNRPYKGKLILSESFVVSMEKL
jgi:hypothetical protein